MTPHFDDDADLNRGQDDPVMAHVIDDLDTLYNASAQPPHLRAAMDRAIYERCAVQRQCPARQRRASWWRRRKVVISGVAIAAIIAGGASAASPLVDRLLPAVVLHHSQDLDLSQSACGFTMTVTRAYIDGNSAWIGFTLTGPSGRAFVGGMFPFDAPAVPRLTDGYGHNLLLLRSGMGVVNGPVEGNAMIFDASALPHASGPIPLHLTVPYIAMTEQLTGTKPMTVACETYRQSSVPPRFRPSKTPSRVVAVRGPFTFNLKVPLLRQVREADPHMVAQAHGERVTLERVAVTPTFTHVYLRRAAGAGKDLKRPRLTTTTGTYEAIPLSIHTATGSQPYVDNITNPSGIVDYAVMGPPLYNDHHAWTLVVPTHHGSVTFHVTVP